MINEPGTTGLNVGISITSLYNMHEHPKDQYVIIEPI